ncbi:chaperone [Lithospermum erythrorhizon]|uniref:Chaperone n=1 Tax=Lithospermum erythrorhizon TaxID=34254 RepID=A0AAV3P1M9_LITER
MSSSNRDTLRRRPTPTSTTPPPHPATPPSTSDPSMLKAYSLPLLLFIAALFFQLVVVPRSFPVSHYDVLGIKRYSTVEEVHDAYDKLKSKWDSDIEVPSTIDFIKVQYAFELLTNELWKRDYDVFGIDEQYYVIDELMKQQSVGSVSKVNLPLLQATAFDLVDEGLEVLNSDNFLSKRMTDKPLLIQVFSLGSHRSAEFLHNWKRIVKLLEGVANAGMVELENVQLVTYLAERRSNGQPLLRNGVPAIVASPAGCKNSGCLVRYWGELSVDAVTDWVASTILSLPRILYFSKETLVKKFLAKVGPHKVKVIIFSGTGERATPFIRQIAKKYWPYASFAYVLWHEKEASIWWNMFGVDSAPAIVFLKDPGVKPIVYQGLFNSSMFTDLIEKNKHQVLPQLRSVTSMELGCDARGFSRAGNDTRIWYCGVLAGRLSQELFKMRETMRSVQDYLSLSEDVDTSSQESTSARVAVALEQKRLTFTWLDGETQKKYCFFHINSETAYETCGPRRDISDIPQLFIIRYERNASENDTDTEKPPPRTIFEALNKVDVDPASQLVAKYNGLDEIPEIIKWISDIIKDGDSRELPSFKTKAPELVPEDAEPIWSSSSEKVMSASRGLKQRSIDLINKTYDYLSDPRIGPIMLLGALLTSANIWLKRNQPTKIENSDHSAKSGKKGKGRPRRKTGPGTGSDQLFPPSITDEEPTNARQMEFSDSDSN